MPDPMTLGPVPLLGNGAAPRDIDQVMVNGQLVPVHQAIVMLLADLQERTTKIEAAIADIRATAGPEED